MDKAAHPLHPHRTESYASLCETAKLISSALDGASERAVLCANDGIILYMTLQQPIFYAKPLPSM